MERMAAARALSALPRDVLRIVLKDISLQDRLQMELVDKSHRDALREPELWQDLNLRAMQALHLTEKQLLRLLERLNSGSQQFSYQSFIQPLLHLLRDPVGSFKGLLANLRKKGIAYQKDTGKAAVTLDFCGTAKLSPEFVAACVLGLSAAGFKVDLKMDGDSDPPFPLHHVVSLLRILAVSCTIQANLLINGLYPGWKGRFLKGFNPKSLLEQGHDFVYDPEQSLLDYTRESRFFEYEGSEAPCRWFDEEILTLLQHASEIAMTSGRPEWLRKGSVRP
ncbi:hypothetical protein KFL_005370030 [Klebsormidium nitens]|uniref:F-box domain-containing protein n=1 Tax=Klebsormidium nitens TaxID=105231 RepID=A0A1Y1ILC4_KLENI|nr:hypothetical protein KFL_005370030 [Klebsormidium nitens]|eukprot:GAQ89566.1 hypothetical protein KFL_005370030 [Klebsormidium nitens]